MDFRELYGCFTLDESSGVLTWKERDIPGSWNSRFAGKPAGTAKGNGHLMVRINSRALLVHRVVFMLATGTDPGTYRIDHINGKRSDNRPENLRLSTQSENVRKRHVLNSNNTSGVHGVHWSAAARKWTAQIKVKRQEIYLGVFSSIEDAKTARKKAELRYFENFQPTV